MKQRHETRPAVGLGALAKPLASASAMAERNGLTWGSAGPRNEFGLHMVSCTDGNQLSCNAYHGDTSCA